MADREAWVSVPFEWDVAHMARDHMGHARCDSTDGCVVRVPGALFIEDRKAAVERMADELVRIKHDARLRDLGDKTQARFRCEAARVLAAALNEEGEKSL